MSFLDKAKSKATQLAQQAKEKIDDVKENRKVDELLDELGRISYRQHTGRGQEGDTAEIGVLVKKLQEMEAEGADVLARRISDADSSATSGGSTTSSEAQPAPTEGAYLPPPSPSSPSSAAPSSPLTTPSSATPGSGSPASTPEA